MQVSVTHLRALILRQGWFSGGFRAVFERAGAVVTPEPGSPTLRGDAGCNPSGTEQGQGGTKLVSSERSARAV